MTDQLIPYMEQKFQIGFQIGKATFLVDCHKKLFQIMKIKEVDLIEALVVYPDMGLCLTKFQIYIEKATGEVAHCMCGRRKVD